MKELSARAVGMEVSESNQEKETDRWNLSWESYEFVSWSGNVQRNATYMNRNVAQGAKNSLETRREAAMAGASGCAKCGRFLHGGD
jgi:hypothetical protein